MIYWTLLTLIQLIIKEIVNYLDKTSDYRYYSCEEIRGINYWDNSLIGWFNWIEKNYYNDDKEQVLEKIREYLFPLIFADNTDNTDNTDNNDNNEE